MSYKEKRELELKKEAEEKAAKAAAEVSFIRRKKCYFPADLRILAEGSNIKYYIGWSGFSPEHF